MNPEIYLNVKQVAERFRVRPCSIWRWAKNGDFPAPRKLSPGCTRWRASDVKAWEESREVAGQ